MKNWFTQVVTVLFAILASSCCALPLLLVLLGASSIGFAAALTPYRHYFMGLTVLSISISFYFSYRKPKPCDDGTCETPNPKVKRFSRMTLRLTTVLALGILLYEFSH